MQDKRAIGIGVIGLGFMGRTHMDAYVAARDAGYACSLRAVADRNADKVSDVVTAAAPDTRGSGSAPVRGYDAPEALLADENVDVVSICTHTDSHVDLAIKAIEAGKHVLVEKPVALDSADVRRLAKAAAGRTRCMPAMCMRFWPGWSWLKERIEQRTYGVVQSAVFRRLGDVPAWAPAFYLDVARSGGAIIDLHIHDADMILWCFGRPRAVVSTGCLNHVTTFYRFDEGPKHVVAEGGWDRAGGLAFQMGYRVAFEDATVEYDFTREPRLLVAAGDKVEPVELTKESGYDVQVRHLLDAVHDESISLAVTMADAVRVSELLEAERRSVETGAVIAFEPRG